MSNLKKLTITTFAVITLIIAFRLYGQITDPAQRNERIKIISFTNTQGQKIRAKVIEEDRSQVVVSQPQGSKLKTVIYSRNEIISDTVFQQTISEFEYWQKMGQYFSNRTWDFDHDADDFIQAIRCYENAKKIVAAIRGPQHELTIDVHKKIEKLEQQKQQWTIKLKERIELRELETKSQLTDKLEKIDERIIVNNEVLATLNQDITALAEKMETLNDLKGDIEKDRQTMDRQISDLIKKIDSNTREIDYIWRKYRDRYEYYYKYSPNINN